MCLWRFFKKKNEMPPAGPCIGNAKFRETPAGQSPSPHERALYELFDKNPAKLTAEERALRAETEEAFLMARRLLGKASVDIGSAVRMPLSMAKFLAVRGFRVVSIRTGVFAAEEKEAFAWLAVHLPEIRIAEDQEDADAALYLDGRVPVMFRPETEELESLALRMAETAGKMHFVL